MITRTRKRPRDKSVSFRTYGWLCVHEAAFAILVSTYGPRDTTALRRWLVTQPCASLRRQCTRLLRQDRGRGFWP